MVQETVDARTPQRRGPNRQKSPFVRSGHGAAARLAFEDATRFHRSANRGLGDEMVRQALSHLAVAFEGTAGEQAPSAMSFGDANERSTADD